MGNENVDKDIQRGKKRPIAGGAVTARGYCCGCGAPA